jgi:tetratricopeptide (TPR) repeat protein
MRALVVLGFVLTVSSALAQDRPSKQNLPEDVAQRIDQLRGDMDKALAEGELKVVATKVAELRQVHSTLPAGHWQRRSGEHLATRFEKLAAASEADRKTYCEALTLLDKAAEATRMGKHAEAEAALAKVLTIHQKLFPAPSHDLADTYLKIATTLREGNKLPQAKAYAEGALTMMQQVWGEHPWVARTHLIVGDIVGRNGDGDAAEQHFRRAWELSRLCLGPASELAQAAKTILVKNLVERERERQAEAVERLHLLDELDCGLGPTHVDTMAACRSAAEVVEASGDAAGAEPLHRRVLAYQQANNGPPAQVVETMQVLVMNLLRQNKTTEVEALARKMLELQVAQGDDHPGTPIAWMVLGEALLALHKVEPGLEALNKAIELRRKQKGENSPGTIAAINRLAHALNDLGRPAEAEPHFRKCLEVGVKVAGENNGNVAALRCNLANCLRDQGKLDEAEKCLAEAARVLQQLEGTPGVGSATALLNLGSVMLAKHKYEEALGLYARAHEAIQQTAGEKHPLMAHVYADMGSALQQLGKVEQAEVVLGQAVTLERKMQGADSAPHAVAQCDLAECLIRRGKAGEAEKMARQAVAALGKVAPGTPELACANVTLGKTLDAQGKLTEGEGCYRQALTLLQARETPERRMGKIYAALGANLHRQKRDADAEPILRKALAGMRQEPLTMLLDQREMMTALTETLTAVGKAAEAKQIQATGGK